MSEKIAVLISRFNDHIQSHAILNNKMEDIEGSVQKLLTNHLPHLQAEMIELRTNLKWHTKIGGIIGGAVAGIFTGGLTILFNFLLK